MESEKHFYIILSFSTSDHALMVLLKSFSLKASLSLNPLMKSDKKDMSFMLMCPDPTKWFCVL